MIIETLVWIVFTLFIVLLSALKMSYFMQNKKFKQATADLYYLKTKPSKSKTIDDKKDYLREKTTNGKDIITMVMSSIIYILGFSMLFAYRVPNLYVGLVCALFYSLVFSWVFAKTNFKDTLAEYKVIDSFIGYWFAATFIIYVRFLDNLPILVLVLISIAIMFLTNSTINKWVGNDGVSRI